MIRFVFIILLSFTVARELLCQNLNFSGAVCV